MASFFQSRGFRRFRVVFRWVRMALWLAILLVVAAAGYLQLIGLPDFLKRPLLNHLRERGFEVRFASARVGWGPDVVIENAAFQRVARPLGARLSAARTQVYLNLAGLLRRRVRVDSLLISGGRLELPFSPRPGDFLLVNDVSLNVALLSNDTVRVENGRAGFHGVQVTLQGAVTNFTASRDWLFWPGAKEADTNEASAMQRGQRIFLGRLAETLDKIHFGAPPRLDVKLSADGRQPESPRMELAFDAAGAETPWGEVKGLMLTADATGSLNPESHPVVKIRVSADAVSAPQVEGRNFYLTVDLSRNAASNLEAAINVAAADFQGGRPLTSAGDWLRADRLQWNGTITLRPAKFAILSATGTGQAAKPATRWGSAEAAAITFQATARDAPREAGTNGGIWAAWNRWAVEWRAELTKIVNTNIQAEELRVAGRWRAPELEVDHFDVALDGGKATGRARLNTVSREMTANAAFDFDERRISRFLTPAARRWMAQYDWEKPPKVEVAARVVWPAWTNRAPDWRAEVLPTLRLAGNFAVGPSSFRHLSITSAQGRFSYSNRVWDLPRLRATRPEGDLYLDYTGSDQTLDFHFVIDTQWNPGALRDLLPEKQRTLLDEVVFSEPPKIHGEARGRWHELEKAGFSARVTATNFTAHGEAVAGLAGTVEYTNGFFRVADAEVFKDGGKMSVPAAAVDLRAKRIFVSNAASTLDVGIVTRVLGARTPPWLRALRFDTPPTIGVNGSLVWDDPGATDLRFAVSGRNLHWTTLEADEASGLVQWTGRSVAVTNVQARLYGGTLLGWSFFDYAPKMRTAFRAQVAVAKIGLPLLERGFNAKTKHLEGALDGNINIAGDSFTDQKSWHGEGNILVRDALLWDIKLFGIFSPLLNAIVPGSGNSRAYHASGDFVITNAMIATDNLEIQSTGFRIIYHGTVNADRQLDARVEAQVLRDTPVFGPLFRWAFSPLTKLFEYKITGTLDAPVSHPLYIPKFLMYIIRPFHTLKGFLPPAEPATPSVTPPPPPKNVK